MKRRREKGNDERREGKKRAADEKKGFQRKLFWERKGKKPLKLQAKWPFWSIWETKHQPPKNQKQGLDERQNKNNKNKNKNNSNNNQKQTQLQTNNKTTNQQQINNNHKQQNNTTKQQQQQQNNKENNKTTFLGPTRAKKNCQKKGQVDPVFKPSRGPSYDLPLVEITNCKQRCILSDMHISN